jgi:type I restriction enzyme S subunit
LDSRFLNYTLASLPILQQLEAQSSGVTMKGFSAEALGNQKIPFPDIKTQCAIAEYLDTETARIDALIEKKQRMIELLERRSAATLDDRLSGLFRPDVPLVPLRHVLRERDQRAVGSETVLSVYRDYGVIVKASREDNFNKTPDDLSNYKIVRRGDVVVNKMKAWQGSLGVSSHDGIVSGDYLVCETTSAAVMHDYLHHLLRSPLLIGQYGVRSTGIRPSQWRLYWDDFASVRIPVPSASEQAELAGALEREYQLTRRLLDVVDGSIGPLREHRQALIIAAVTGELEVPEVAA